MSWGRFALAAILTTLVLIPVGAALVDLVEPIAEPLRTILLVAIFLAVLVVIDRLLLWVTRRIRARPDAGREDDRDGAS